jgi:arylsulfatase A
MSDEEDKTKCLIFSVVLVVLSFNATAQNPNVIIILAEDLGYGDLSCYNSDSKIPTPDMDQLATVGLRFTDAHSSSSVCFPSQYEILTGTYCWRTKFRPPDLS